MTYFKTTLALLIALVSVGCGQNNVDSSKIVDAPTGADQALTIVLESYGLRADQRPTVLWYGGAALNCVDQAKPWCGDGGICWRSDNGAGCTAGEELDDGILLVSTFGGAALHDTPLAHEVAHFASEARGEGKDPGHTGHFFANGGELDIATAVLIADGL